MLRILVPEPDATIRSSAGEIIVSVTSEPGLQKVIVTDCCWMAKPPANRD